jgi:hypothetical protein
MGKEGFQQYQTERDFLKSCNDEELTILQAAASISRQDYLISAQQVAEARVVALQEACQLLAQGTKHASQIKKIDLPLD